MSEETDEVAFVAPVPIAMYSSHPVANFNIAGQQFVKGRLDFFDDAAHDAFVKELDWFAKNQPTTRAVVKKIDLAAAEAFLSTLQPAAVNGPADSGMVRAGIELSAEFAKDTGKATGPITKPAVTS